MHSAHIRGHLETIRYINITGYTGGDRGKWNKDLQMILDRGTCDKEGFIVPNRRGERRGQDNVSHFENKTYRLRMKFAPLRELHFLALIRQVCYLPSSELSWLAVQDSIPPRRIMKCDKIWVEKSHIFYTVSLNSR